MSCTDTGESSPFLRLTDVIPKKKAAAPFFQATLENSRSQFQAWSNTAASALVVSTAAAAASAPQKAASPRATRSSAGSAPRRHEPGHDLAAHGDLERHCGTPWFS